MNLNDISKRSYYMSKNKKKNTKKQTTDGVTYVLPDDATTSTWSPMSEAYTVSYGVTPSGASIGDVNIGTGPIDFGADAGKGFENMSFDDWIPPRPFEDTVPSLKDLEEMCAEYPSLKIAYEKFRNIFRICYDDWKTKTGGDVF
jgi:hypothetical protein